MGKVKVDRKLWLDKDKKFLVEDGDNRAAFLYCAQGNEVDKDELEALGFADLEKDRELKEKKKPEDKSVKKPNTKGKG